MAKDLQVLQILRRRRHSASSSVCPGNIILFAPRRRKIGNTVLPAIRIHENVNHVGEQGMRRIYDFFQNENNDLTRMHASRYARSSSRLLGGCLSRGVSARGVSALGQTPPCEQNDFVCDGKYMLPRSL